MEPVGRLPPVGIVEVFSFDISKDDRDHIDALITTLATSNYAWLFLYQEHVRTLGENTRHIGALHFFAHVCRNPTLKEYLNTMSQYSLVWTPFIKGFRKKFESSPALLDELPYFANFVERNHTTLASHAETRNWDKFVRHLL